MLPSAKIATVYSIDRVVLYVYLRLCRTASNNLLFHKTNEDEVDVRLVYSGSTTCAVTARLGSWLLGTLA